MRVGWKVVVLLANLRLRDVGTDMLVTMYRTVEAGELSSSRAVDAAGEGGGGDTGDETPEMHPGLSQFVKMLRTLTIRDVGLFG